MTKRDELHQRCEIAKQSVELRIAEIAQIFDDGLPSAEEWPTVRSRILALLRGAHAERDKIIQEVRDANKQD